MKKKIRDLTDEEMEKICDKNIEKYNSCYGCSLRTGVDGCFKYLDLDKEIEVKENGR